MICITIKINIKQILNLKANYFSYQLKAYLTFWCKNTHFDDWKSTSHPSAALLQALRPEKLIKTQFNPLKWNLWNEETLTTIKINPKIIKITRESFIFQNLFFKFPQQKNLKVLSALERINWINMKFENDAEMLNFWLILSKILV